MKHVERSFLDSFSTISFAKISHFVWFQMTATKLLYRYKLLTEIYEFGIHKIITTEQKSNQSKDSKLQVRNKLL